MCQYREEGSAQLREPLFSKWSTHDVTNSHGVNFPLTVQDRPMNFNVTKHKSSLIKLQRAHCKKTDETNIYQTKLVKFWYSIKKVLP